ncbi:MAG: ATP-dependent endonuclease [Elusimicrobia bacterium]|nr:ATP-dependent endonuclease [Elusimicrobiota bacterium]
MKLSTVQVRNFRSIKDTGPFQIQPFFAFIGENNNGKSNLLRAIDVLLSAGSGPLTRADFNDHESPIIVKGEFDFLSENEKKRWRPYLVANRLTLEKRVSLTADDRSGKEKLYTEFHGYRAEPLDWFLSLEKIQNKSKDRPRWTEIVRDCRLPDYFLEEGKCNKTIFEKGLRRYLDENEVKYDDPDLSTTKALGLQSYVISSLPSLYLLPAITNYEDEIDRRSSTSTFRRLMGDLSERILKTDPRYTELKSAIATVGSLLNKSATEGGNGINRMGSIGTVEEKIGELIRRMMPSVNNVSLNVEMQEIRDIFSSGVTLKVNDGVETDVLAKGHGLQRCLVFTLLQTLILNERDQLVGPGKGNSSSSKFERPIILLVEEPELYIHPQLAKLFYDVMKDFSQTDQVIYTTHSPLFVNASESANISIVSKKTIDDGTKVKNCDKSAFDGLGDEKLFKCLAKLNPSINELFFAKKVLLVEGPEDLIAITATLQKLERIRTRVEEIDWSIIPCGGKDSIPFFQMVLNAFHIPYSVLHDYDIRPDMTADNKKTQDKINKKISNLSRSRRVHVFPIRLEASLGLFDNHFDSQYDALVFFANPSNITEEVEQIISEALELNVNAKVAKL